MIWVRAARLSSFLNSYGLFWGLRFFIYRCFGGLAEKLTKDRAKRAIRDVLRRRSNHAKIIVIKSMHDYRFPYSQRSHHLARALASSGDLVFFISPATGYDQVAIIEQLDDNLFVTPHLNVLGALCSSAVLIIFSTDVSVDEKLLNSWGGTIVYDYIDAIDDSVSNGPVTREHLQLHARLLRSENSVICLASASKLLEEVATFRSRNFGLVENAVDTAHYRVQRDKAALLSHQRAIIEDGKPLAGYFGALAHWVDYDLLIQTARALPGINFIAIGIDYDRSVIALRKTPENLHVLPPVDYSELPTFAVWFDVGLLPFKVNHITTATSPLKLFEYMALGLPIVSTAIPEARKYRSVRVANTSAQFAANVFAALADSKSPSCRQSILAEARENDWMARAAAIAHLLEAHSSRAIVKHIATAG